MNMESSDFFRRDAVTAAGTSLGRASSWRTHSPSWAIVALLALLLAGSATLLICADFARKESAQGSLVPSGGAVRIAPISPGVISAVHVHDGDLVRAGQKLITISLDSVVSNGASVADLLSNATVNERAATTLQTGAQIEEAQRRQEDVLAQAAGLDAEVPRLQSNIVLARERVRLASQTAEASQKIFEKGYLSAVSMREREEALIAAKQALSAAETQLASNRTQHTQLHLASAQADATLRRLRAEGDLARAAISEKEAQVARSRSIVLTAARTGRIAGLTAKVGSPVTPDQLLATLLPSGEALVAEMWIPSRAIGFIRPGNRVRIMLDSFPYERFGVQRGSIIYVSRVPSEGRSPPQQANQAQEPMFRVLAKLDRQNIEAYGQAWPLTPGMRLSGEIVLERRSLLDWLIDPLLALRGRNQAQ